MGKSVSFISPPKESHQFKLNYQNMRYSSDWKLFPNHFFHRKSIVVLSAAKLIGAKRNIGRREYFKISPPWIGVISTKANYYANQYKSM